MIQIVYKLDGALRVWIPRSNASLIIRLCVVAHAGPSCHVGTNATCQILTPRYHCSGLI